VKPPIFSAQPTGTKPQQYLHRARMFRDAAIGLPDYSNGEQYWPKYALLAHAIELALKAFAQHSVDNGSRPGKNQRSTTCLDGIGWRSKMGFRMNREWREISIC
jgi:hypothetical protein